MNILFIIYLKRVCLSINIYYIFKYNRMTERRQEPSRILFISKDSIIRRTSRAIQAALDRYAEIQLRSAGTASQKCIVIAQHCVSQGIALYSRFTTQPITHEGKQIIYTVIKLRRPNQGRKQFQEKKQKGLYKQKPQYQTKRTQINQQKRPQNNQYQQKNQRFQWERPIHPQEAYQNQRRIRTNDRQVESDREQHRGSQNRRGRGYPRYQNNNNYQKPDRQQQRGSQNTRGRYPRHPNNNNDQRRRNQNRNEDSNEYTSNRQYR